MAFNPTVSITGNGIPGQVSAVYYTFKSDWTLQIQNNPGLVLTGGFPNSKNLYSIQPSSQEFQFPYRGGKNLPNLESKIQASNTVIGISAVGLLLYGPSAGIIINGPNGSKWSINEPVANVLGCDIYSGAPNLIGTYVYRDGRFIKNNAWGSISGSTWAGGNYRQADGHSKIIGWARDGYPIYGPYGYSTATNALSSVRKMVSGYQINIKPNRPATRNVVVRGPVTSSYTFGVYSIVGIGIGMDLTGSGITTSTRVVNIIGTQIIVDSQVTFNSGDLITGSYTNGVFIEDWTHYQTTSTVLDLYNGRFCVTPEFPNGTYAYFVTTDVNNNPTYPYIVGPYFYGRGGGDSTSTSLSNLIPYPGTLSPQFSLSINNYSVTVTNETKFIAFLPITSNPNSTIVFNSLPVVSGSETGRLPLVVGTNTSTIIVTSQYLTTGQYNITINRLRNSNKNLKNLSIVSKVFSPIFNSNILIYNLTVETNVYSIDIIPTIDDDLSTIKINDVITPSEQPNKVNLSLGSNTINIVVTAEDTTTKTYVINATRLSDVSLLSNIEVSVGSIYPAFNNQTFFYDVVVPNDTVSIQAKGILVDLLSSLKINGIIKSSGQYSEIINLKTGINPIAFTVDSSNQQTSHLYRINVFREFNSVSTLTSISISKGTLSPSFSSSITGYIVSVLNSTTNILVTPNASDINSTIKINQILVLSGNNVSVPLIVGSNTIPVTVTAENGVSETTYSINVVRAGSNISTLTNLLVDGTTLYPSFSPNVLNYTATVAYSINSTRIFPVSTNKDSSITVNNSSVISGIFSQSIPLNVNTNTIITKVVSQDQLNSSTYTIIVTRKKNNDATLAGIYFEQAAQPPDITIPSIRISQSSDIVLRPSFSSTITNYFITRPYGVTNIKFAAFATDSNVSAIEVSNGVTEITTSSGAESNIELLGKIDGAIWNGLTQIQIKVTAADAISTKTYTLNVTRIPNNISTLSNLSVDIGPLSPDFNPTVSEYYYNVPYLTSMARISATASYSLQKIYILIQNTYALLPSGNTVDVNLIVGNNTIGILSYAADGITVTGYNIYINRSQIGLSDNAFLSDITLSTGTYTPIFNKTIYTYNSKISYDTKKIKIKASKENSFANIKINNVDVISGTYSTDIDLDVGEKIIDIDVFAEDGATTKKYKLHFFREGNTNSLLKDLYISYGQLDKLFSPYITNYVVNIPAQVDQVSVKPIVDDYQAVVGVNNVGVAAGQGWSDPSNVIVGNNLITIIVTAGNAINRTTYTVNFIKSNQIEHNVPIVPIVPIKNVNIPQWITPKGFITTATEGEFISSVIVATGTNISYKLISGSLPPNLSLNTNTGIISGVPNLVYITTSSEFLVRATNSHGIADRKFYIDVYGPTPPVLTTAGPKPNIGPSGESYLINGQIVDFQFTATTDILPPGKNIEFFIAEGDGQLPPGLSLSLTGRLYGTTEDDLSIFYQSGSIGGYDREGFDVNPYDHESTQEFGYGGKTQYVNKIYKFYVSASNGIGIGKALYEIDILDPLTFVNTKYYPIAPQWITPSNLGTIRSNSYQNISLEIHDCDPGKGTISYDWLVANFNDFSKLPPGLSLDRTTGVIYGFVSYTPVHSKTYTFNVRVIKTNILTNTYTTRYKEFSLTILGYSLNPNIEYITDSILGDIYQGEQSEFSVKAVSVDPAVRITYNLIKGTLPSGLSLISDGSIQGIHTYNTTTLITNTYSFAIRATTSDLTGQIEKTFSINTLPYTGKKYTKILFRPLLIDSSENLYKNFINDITIFDPNLLYRPYDQAFGVQKSLEFVLEHAIEQLNLTSYVPAMQNYFYRKKLEFGDLKVAIGSYKNKILYELIYIEIVDKLIDQNGISVKSSINFDNITVYTNSIDTMRTALESVATYNTKLFPKFMNTIQPLTGTPLGRILHVPICYCLPGNSTKVLINIKKYGMDFKKINFEIDRLIVLNSLDNSEAKYLLFPRT